MMAARIAYCVIPESGGLFRFYRNLRAALTPHGWEVFAVCMGPAAAGRWDPRFADENCTLIAPQQTDGRQQARAFVEWVERQGIAIVVPMDDSIAASAARHLPPQVRLVTRCSSDTGFAYKICGICVERLSRVIVMTPRQLRGVSGLGRLPQERIAMIPHGVDMRRFSPDLQSAGPPVQRPLRIAYVGRLDDKMKGTLWLPDIVARLVRLGVEFEFDVIGDGEDRARLTSLLQREGIEKRCRLRGTMQGDELAKVLPACDVLVMPSRVEGFPNVLVEAMASGLVAVASRIRGVTDFIVEDGVSGVLCRIGNTKAFAEAIAGLAADRTRLATMSAAARRTVEERFSLQRMGRDYDRVLRQALAEPLANVAPRPWSDFRIDPAFKPGWRRWVPRAVKDTIRRYVH